MRKNTNATSCKAWKVRNPASWLLSVARYRAKQLGVPFTITKDDIIVPAGKNSPNAPSLDRVIPSLGYVPRNVCVISRRANSLKSDATPDELSAVAAYARLRSLFAVNSGLD
jgi:hypothetical protein